MIAVIITIEKWSQIILIFTIGLLEPLEKNTINRKKPQKRIAQEAAMKMPDKIVSQMNTKEDDSVEQTMRKIRKLIVCYCKETLEPLDLFQLIIHPQDFGRTIKNLLHVSFLIKDGVLKLSKGEFRIFFLH